MKRMTIQEKKNYTKSSVTDYKYSNTRGEDVLRRYWKIKIKIKIHLRGKGMLQDIYVIK